MKTLKLAPLFILLLITIFSASANAAKLDSFWRDRDVTIDGMQPDWENTLSNFEDEKINVGIMNDKDYLYICLVPLDDDIIKQMVSSGFTVWVEPKGNKENKIGIRYPIGMKKGGMDFKNRPGNPPDENYADTLDRPDGPPDMQNMGQMGQQLFRDVQIISADKNDTTMLVAGDLIGLEVMAGYRNERLVYELRIPFRATEDNPYALGEIQKGEVKIKFAADEMKMPGMKGPGGEGGGPGGGGGNMPPGGGSGGMGMPGGGGPGGGGPGGGPSGEQQSQSQFKFDLDVKLAMPEPPRN